MTNEEIFNKNIKIAYKVAYKYQNCGIEFDELEQLCLLGLWKAIITYRKESSALSTYAYSVIRNEICMYLRKNKKHALNKHLSDIVVDNITLEEVIADDNDHMGELERKIYIEDYIKKLKKASLKERKIIDLKIKGATQQDIAKILNISQPQVSRTIKKMKKYLE